jgi:glycosyltransferase involved in cell wall biosynthesis
VTRGTRDISVIIPFYNRERYVDEAVQSVLAQTLKPLEIIIVNDCSRESSRRFLDRYQGVCTILDLPVNVGLGGSRNAGIRAARGSFIALLDDDDIWLPHKLEWQRKYLQEHPECSGVHTSVWAMLPDQRDTLYRRFGTWWIPDSVPEPGPARLTQVLMNDYWAIPSTMMFRTDVVRAVNGFDVKFRQCEDRDFMIRLCAAGYQIDALDEPLVKLRREGHSNLSGRRWRIFRTDLRVCWKHRALYFGAFGFWGIALFVLDKLQEPTFGIRYVYGAVRRLLWWVQPKCRIKSSYREPVGNKDPLARPAPRPIDRATLIGGHPL